MRQIQSSDWLVVAKMSGEYKVWIDYGKRMTKYEWEEQKEI